MLVVFHVDEEGVVSRDRCYRAIYFQADKQLPGSGRKVRRDFWASRTEDAQKSRRTLRPLPGSCCLSMKRPQKEDAENEILSCLWF